MVRRNKILFYSLLIGMLIIVTITIINARQYLKLNSETPDQVVEQICKFTRYGDKKSLQNLVANVPSDFSYRLYIASGGHPLKENDTKSISVTSPNRQNLSGDELLKDVIFNSFSLNEKINIKEFLEVSQFQDEAKVKVLLGESDFNKERICTFLLTKYKNEWKVFWIDNGGLPKNFVFGQLPENDIIPNEKSN